MRLTIFVTSILGLLQRSRAQSASENSTSQACLQLSQQYPNQTSSPGQPEYTAEYLENWSETCVQQPYCVFVPTSAEDVAGAISVLTRTNTSFAVRGGGHMQVPGASAITNGVLISSDQLNQKDFINEERTAASIGPGNRWVDVYRWLSPYKLAIIGGRYQPVGVPGLLLGGGISYFGSQHGWAANNVINYQIVLANATIIDANSTYNQDLWWALKGGSNNFGIVTRFDVSVYPLPGVYGGTTAYQPQYLDDFLYAVSNYSAPDGGSSDVLTSVNPTVQWNFTQGGYELVTISTRNSTANNTDAFKNFTAIPQISSDATMHEDLVQLTNDTALTGLRNTRALYFSKGVQATPEAISLTNRTYFEAIAASPAIQAARGMLVAATYQTISQAWLSSAVASGGDAIDLDPDKGGFIAFLGAMLWEDEADDELAYAFAYNMTDTITTRVEAAGLNYPFVYMNDATLNQAVFQFYGEGRSESRLDAVARAYDPKGVFQTLVPGGFKLTAVNQTRPVDLDKRII